MTPKLHNAYHRDIETVIIYPNFYCQGERGNNYAKMGYWQLKVNETKTVLGEDCKVNWTYCVHAHTLDRQYTWGQQYSAYCPKKAFDECFNTNSAGYEFFRFHGFKATNINMIYHLHIWYLDRISVDRVDSYRIDVTSY